MKTIQVTKQFIVNDHGEKKAVILPIDEYQELLEDLHDLAMVAEWREEPTISHPEVYNKLKNDGFI